MKSIFKAICASLALLATTVHSQDTVTVSEDSFVRGGSYENTNYGSVTTLNVKKPSSNLSYLRNAYLKFDVTNYSNVSSATMYIYARAKSAMDVNVGYASDDNWNENSITYANAPNFNSYDSVALSTSYQWVSLDVTTLVQNETSSGNGILSLAFNDANNLNTMIYVRSKEYSNSDYAAYLEIEEEVPSAPTRDIYLVIGQSNTAGRGLIEAEDNVPLSGVDLLNTNGQWESAYGGMNRYSTIKKTTYQGVNYAYTFGKVINQITGNQVGIVCNAQGGSSIGQWAVDGEFYNEAVARTQQAIAAGGELKGILWHQGEANRNNSSWYLSSLNNIVTALRAELGNVPFIAGQLSQDRDTDTANDNFNAMMEGISSVISDADYAESIGLTTNADGLESGDETDATHFDNYSQRILGRRYAAKVLSLIYGLSVNTYVIPGIEDSYLRAGSNATLNYGSETLVRIKEQGDTNKNTRRAILKFNTTEVTGQVIDASMVVYGDVRSGSNVLETGIYKYSSSWSEGSVTFSNAPALGDKMNIINFRGITATDYNLPIATYFIEDYSQGAISIALKGEESGAEQFRICSTEGSSATRPYITFTTVERASSLNGTSTAARIASEDSQSIIEDTLVKEQQVDLVAYPNPCLLYTSDAADD